MYRVILLLTHSRHFKNAVHHGIVSGIAAVIAIGRATGRAGTSLGGVDWAYSKRPACDDLRGPAGRRARTAPARLVWFCAAGRHPGLALTEPTSRAQARARAETEAAAPDSVRLRVGAASSRAPQRVAGAHPRQPTRPRTLAHSRSGNLAVLQNKIGLPGAAEGKHPKLIVDQVE
jgi:hypothetical protein